MCTITDMTRRWVEAQASFVETGKDVLQAHAEYVVDLNKDQLYNTGRDAHGNKLRPYSQASELGREYAEMKHRMNPQPGDGQPDLFLTGQLYSRMYLRLGQGTMEVADDDPKAAGLKEKFGDFLGLDDDSIDRLQANVLHPGIAAELCEQTGCGK